jgi:hypothetical protein
MRAMSDKPTKDPDCDLDDYRWWNSPQSDEWTIVGEQDAIACYWGGTDCVVLRQKGDMYEERDARIIIQPENLRKVIGALVGMLNRFEGGQS